MSDVPPPPPIVVLAPPAQAARCRGELVSRIEVHRYAPSSRSAAARARGALEAATDTLPVARGAEIPGDQAVVLAYVRLRPGQPCRERDRADSERMLRAQRFIASAAVTPLPDGRGRVRIRVDVVEELSWVIGGRLRGLSLQEVRFGSLDVNGEGRLMVASVSRGGAYRPGAGLEVQQPGFLGRPAMLETAVAREPLGGFARLAVSQPFLANGQRDAVFASLSSRTEYGLLVRPEAPDGAVRTRRGAQQLGWLRRVGAADGPVVGLAGLFYVGETSTADAGIVRVTDEGLVRTDDSTLVGRYRRRGANHLAGVAGVRALRFRPVARFDALRAEQDVATGVEATLLAGPRVGDGPGTRDALVGAGFYAGGGDSTSFVTLRVRGEGHASALGTWGAVVSSARLTWYRLPDARRTRQVALSASAVHAMPYPAQLTLRDPEGGLLGHADSRLAGGRRVAVRWEERWLTTAPGGRFDLAVGVFGDAGRLWAGDVPFGGDSDVRASAGISLMASYPSGGKRMYRLDVGVPMRRGPGEGAVAIRFSASDRTRVRWPEPADVGRYRVESGQAMLVRW